MGRHMIIFAAISLLTACEQKAIDTDLVPESIPSVPQNTSSTAADSPAANTGDYVQPQDIRPGQMIGKMEVVSNDYEEYSTTSGIRFRGRVTLAGEYWDANAEGGMGPRGICLHKLDDPSKIGLPVRRYADAQESDRGVPRLSVKAVTVDDDEGDGVCFAYEEAIRKGFPKGTRGTATVVVDDFFLELSGLEGKSNTATLIEVSSVEVKERVQSTEESRL